MSAQAKIELQKSYDFGVELLKAFHDTNKRYSNYKLSLDQLLLMLKNRRNQKNFVSILGGVVLDSDTVTKTQAISIMKSLAIKSRGQVPSINVNFIAAIQSKATEFSYVDAVAYTAVATVSDIGSGVKAVGDTLLSTGKILRMIFIPAFFLILGFYIYKRVK